jgi:hypothetical protein
MELLRAAGQSFSVVRRRDLATLFAAGATLAAAGILATVVLHMLRN